MEVKSDVIKDINSAKMSESFASVEVLTERTSFTFSPLMYLLMGSQGCSMFLFKLLIDQKLRFDINHVQVGCALIAS